MESYSTTWIDGHEISSILWQVSSCIVFQQSHTMLIRKQKLLDIAESKSSWLDMALYFFVTFTYADVVGHIQSVQGSALNNVTATTRVVVHFLISPSSVFYLAHGSELAVILEKLRLLSKKRGGWTEGFDEGKANGGGNSVQFNGNEVHDFVSCGESHPESPEIYSLPDYNLNFELVDEEDCCYFQATKKHVVQARGGDIFDVYRKKRSVFLMTFFLYAIVGDLEFRRKIMFVQRQVLLFGLSGFII
ncbi:hypothetical protein HID58_022846, partial [Brassica napus]